MASKIFFFITFSVIFLFAPPLANAYLGHGSVGSGSSGFCTTCGGGSGGGSYKYNEIINLKGGPHKLPIDRFKNRLFAVKQKYIIRSFRGQAFPEYKYADAVEDSIKALDETICKNQRNESCPLWSNKQIETYDSERAFYKIHPLKRNLYRSIRPSPDIVSSFNIRIWREEPRKRNQKIGDFKLIFQRSLDAPDKNAKEKIKEEAKKSKSKVDGLNTTAPVWTNKSAFLNPFANKGWWNAYRGEYYKTGLRYAGPISFPPPPRNSGCQNNIFKNRNRINGSRGVPSSMSFNPSKIKFKRGGNWCYWEGLDFSGSNIQFGPGAGGNLDNQTGLKEALFLKWNFDNYNPTGERPKLSYQLEGVPNRFYIVQAATLDSRQKIMNQSVKVFIANAARQPSQDCPPPGSTPPADNPCDYTGYSPSASIQIASESPLQVKQTSNQKLTLSTNSPLTNYQSIFPRQLTLAHYTPQLNFSSPNSSSGRVYPSNFINYGRDMPVSIPMPDGRNLNGSGSASAYKPSPNVIKTESNPSGSLAQTIGSTLINQSVINSPAFYQGASGIDLVEDPDIVFEKDYKLTWLQPTLRNPCTQEGSVAANSGRIIELISGGQKIPWPKDLSKCEFPTPEGQDFDYNYYKGVPIVNVWDDVLSTGGEWEYVYANGVKDSQKKAFQRGWVRGWDSRGNVLNYIRCYDQPSPGSSQSLPQALDRCREPYIPLVSSSKDEQTAQGSVVVAARDKSRGALRNVRLSVKADVKSSFTGLDNALIQKIMIYPRKDPSKYQEIDSRNGRASFTINLERDLGRGITEAPYIIQFKLRNPSGPPDPSFNDCPERASTCWSLSASYNGFSNLTWYRSWAQQVPWEVFLNATPGQPIKDFSPPENLAYIKVYGSRTSR